MFLIAKKDGNSRARVGKITTSSGRVVETPAYAIVGTHAEVRTLSPEQVFRAKTQLIISNTYHLWQSLGKDLNSFEGLHARMKLPNTVIMTDSGGFQVFSMGFGREHGVGKVLGGEKKNRPSGEDKNLTRITDSGVFFIDERGEHFLGPELSMDIQKKLGADIIFAFDECTSPEHDHSYQKQALQRTHRWAKICLDIHHTHQIHAQNPLNHSREWFSGEGEGKKDIEREKGEKKKEEEKKKEQMLYGIVQGGTFEDLRKESAQYIGALPFDGFGIGGSFGERQMGEILDWVIPHLPEEKPRHLLGIGKIDDIFLGVEKGIDTFDCVIPTREARHGSAWTSHGRIDLKKSVWKNDTNIIEEGCECDACSKAISKKDLREMFKSKDMRAGTLVSIHNIYFFNTLMEKIRISIKENRFSEFKNESFKKLT